MTDTSPISTAEDQHRPSVQLPNQTWQSILSYVSGRLQKDSEPPGLFRWQAIRYAAFLRFPINDDMRLKSILYAIENGLLQSDPMTIAKDLDQLFIEVIRREAQAVIHG